MGLQDGFDARDPECIFAGFKETTDWVATGSAGAVEDEVIHVVNLRRVVGDGYGVTASAAVTVGNEIVEEKLVFVPPDERELVESDGGGFGFGWHSVLYCKWSYWVTYPTTNVVRGIDPEPRTPLNNHLSVVFWFK